MTVVSEEVAHGTAQLRAGDSLRPRQLESVDGEALPIPGADGFVHLQLRRFAGCPVCNLHLRSIANRHEEILASSIREVVVFHSSREELLPFIDELPFAVVADPGKKLYAELGAEFGPRSLLGPRAWGPIARGVWKSLKEVLREGRKWPPLFPAGGRTGLPAEFLIDPDGVVVARKYGRYVYDQWSVDELLSLAAEAR